jgi:hypothetical protein
LQGVSLTWEKAVPLYSKVANSVRLYLNTVGLFLPVRKYQWIPYCATDLRTAAYYLLQVLVMPTLHSVLKQYIAFLAGPVLELLVLPTLDSVLQQYIAFRTRAVHCIPYSSSTLHSVLKQYY